MPNDKLVRRESQPLIPFGQEWEAMKEIAKVLMVGGFINPKTYANPEQVLAVMLAGREMGIGHREALDHISPINGRLALDGVLQLKRAYELIPQFEHEVLERTSKICRLRGRRDPGKIWTLAEFTIEQAARAELTNKDVWRRYPEDMLYWKAVDRLIGQVAPEAACCGAPRYSKEVAQDFEPQPQPKQVESNLDEVVDAECVDITLTHKEGESQ